MGENKDVRTCAKCKKEKKASDGYLKLAGLFFCCKECCDKRGEKKGADAPKTCEFC